MKITREIEIDLNQMQINLRAKLISISATVEDEDGEQWPITEHVVIDPDGLEIIEDLQIWLERKLK